MNIGDKIRMLRAKEQGVITRFLPGNQVEIEIEDGFRIPVMRSEIVVVSPMEATRFQNAPTLEPQKVLRPEIVSNSGLYMAFMPQNTRSGEAVEVVVHLVNNTDWELPVTVGEERGNRYVGLLAGVLKPRTQLRLTQQYSMATFEDWPTFLVQALWHRSGSATLRSPLVKRLKCRAQTFHKAKGAVPVLNQEGHLFQLDEPAGEAKPIEPTVLREKMMGNAEPIDPLVVERPSAAVDLHIEKILPGGPGKRTSAELIEMQIKTFEKALENAIASGMDQITFIHGVGNGVLRSELHRRLGKHSGVQYFEDAQKEKFGYGATNVKLK